MAWGTGHTCRELQVATGCGAWQEGESRTLREEAREVGGHWVLTGPVGRDTEGHCWICLLRRITGDCSHGLRGENRVRSKGKERGQVWVSFLRKFAQGQGLAAGRGWEQGPGAQSEP